MNLIEEPVLDDFTINRKFPLLLIFGEDFH